MPTPIFLALRQPQHTDPAISTQESQQIAKNPHLEHTSPYFYSTKLIPTYIRILWWRITEMDQSGTNVIEAYQGEIVKLVGLDG